MSPKEQALTEFIEKLGKSFNEDYVERIHFLSTQALEERSYQGAKVVELQNFIERNFPESKEKSMHVVDFAKVLISTAYLLSPGDITPEETTATKRLLSVLREQFTSYYQSFEGSFEDWLEIRGLEFVEDRFVPVDIGKTKQSTEEIMQDVFDFFNRDSVTVPRKLYESVCKVCNHNVKVEPIKSKINAQF